MMTSRQRLERLLTWRRTRAYALLLVALYVVAWIDVLLPGNPPLNSAGVPIAGDYIAFHTAGRLVLDGHAASVYEHSVVVGIQDSLLGGRVPGFYDAFRNPPFYALAYAPLAALDLLHGYAVWMVVSLGCLALSVWILLQETPWLRPRWRGVLIFVFAFPPVYFGLIDGENAMVSLLLYALIYRAFVRGQDRALGVWAALGLFKPQLFFVFPLIMLATRRWKALATYVLTAAALAAMSVALVGLDGMQAWLRILLEPEGGNATANGWRMASAKSFLDALLPSSGPITLAIYMLVVVGLLAALLRAWRRAEMELPTLFVFTVLVAALIDPHLVDYDLTALVAAGIVGAALVPRLAWALVPLYLVLLLRAAIPIGDASLQLSAPLLLICTVWIVRTAQPPLAARSAPLTLPEHLAVAHR
jgi:hypothetical protein